MYRGFNLRNIGFNGKELSMANTYDRSHPNVFKSNIIDSIDSFIETEYTFDGNALINKWFPKLNRPDIFISHSHDDENLAKALAMWLEDTFSLTSFIDSTVWGDFTLLRKKINNYFITKLGSRYDCEQQDRVSQHVMMMLNTSLMEMMDRCQCLFFLNTPNSISVKEKFLIKLSSVFLILSSKSFLFCKSEFKFSVMILKVSSVCKSFLFSI